MVLRRAHRLDPTVRVQHLLGLVQHLQGNTIGITVHSKPEGLHGSFSQISVGAIAPDSPAQKAGLRRGDILLGGSLYRSQASALALSGFTSALDFHSLIDSARRGHLVYLDVQSPHLHASSRVAVVRAMGTTSGIPWSYGELQQGPARVQLPLLYQNGIPFGWIPNSSSGSNGSSLWFVNPINPQVSATLLWSFVAASVAPKRSAPLSSNVPASAVVISRALSVSGLPALLYRNVSEEQNSSVETEGLVMDISTSSTMLLLMTAPQAQWTRWQPMFNDMINTFQIVPG